MLHLSVGASTVATKRVIANLFYRGVLLRRPVFEGETLSTTTRVLAMADGSRREGQAPRGKALLGIVTTAGTTLDDAEPVLDYQRCPLIRLRGDTLPGHADEIGSAGGDVDLDAAAAFVPTGWDLEPLGPPTDWAIDETPRRPAARPSSTVPPRWCVSPTTSPPSTATPRRRRTRSASCTAATRSHSHRRRSAACSPTSPPSSAGTAATTPARCSEGDLLSSTHTLIAEQPVASGRLRAFRTIVRAHRGDDVADVLDWVPLVFCR